MGISFRSHTRPWEAQGSAPKRVGVEEAAWMTVDESQKAAGESPAEGSWVSREQLYRQGLEGSRRPGLFVHTNGV